jgi:hypothetical protein
LAVSREKSADQSPLKGGGHIVLTARMESQLDIAQRNVSDGLKIIARQRDLIARLRAAGHATDKEEALLENFELSQFIFEANLAAILKKK